MAVESRFVVIRNGVEVKTFMDKKAADEYDKMLDMADGISELLARSDIELSEEIREDIGIYLAGRREDTLIALQAKKAKPAAKAKPAPSEVAASQDDVEAKQPAAIKKAG